MGAAGMYILNRIKEAENMIGMGYKRDRTSEKEEIIAHCKIIQSNSNFI